MKSRSDTMCSNLYVALRMAKKVRKGTKPVVYLLDSSLCEKINFKTLNRDLCSSFTANTIDLTM